jgi:hypothetical protein
MLGFGFLFQFLTSGRLSFAAAAWLSLVPLAVLVRAGRLPWSALGVCAAVFAGRLCAWVGVVDDAVVGAALAAACTMVVLIGYTHVMRALPAWGSLALPLGVVAVEGWAAHLGWPGLSLWSLGESQRGNVPLWRLVDVLSPLGLSFCVAWAQGALAGIAEAGIVEDRVDQETRERWVRRAAIACFWMIFVGLHLWGFFRSDSTVTTMTAGTSGALVLPLAQASTAAWLALGATATALAVRRRS